MFQDATCPDGVLTLVDGPGTELEKDLVHLGCWEFKNILEESGGVLVNCPSSAQDYPVHVCVFHCPPFLPKGFHQFRHVSFCTVLPMSCVSRLYW